MRPRRSRHRASRWAPRLGAGVLVLLVAVAALPGRASAHAYLDRADPAPGSQLGQAPSGLRLLFTEPLDPGFSRVQVLDARRQQVDRGDSRVSPDDARVLVVSLRDDLPQGLYTVAWRTLSTVDGHSVQGAYPLLVGTVPEGTPAAPASAKASFTPETALARWWLSLAASGVFGPLLAFRLVLTPLLRRRQREGWQAAAARTRRVALAAAGLLVLGIAYGGVAQAAAAADLPLWEIFGAPLGAMLAQGRLAAVWWSRLVLALAALGLVAWGGGGSWQWTAALAVVAALLLSSSLSSHGAALASGAYLAVAADWLHFLAVAAWIGGLLSLVLVLPVAVRSAARDGAALWAPAIGRFTRLALLAVAVIVATGTFQAWVQVGSWEGLFGTAYGASLLAKVGLMALMVGLAATSAFLLRPRLAALVGRGPEVARLARTFRVAVRAELALGVAVLVAAAVLTGLAPAREEVAQRASGAAQAGPVDRRLEAGGLAARVRITPATVGQNRFAVELPGTDPAGVERVQLTLTYLDAELGSQPLVLAASQTPLPTWAAASPLLSQPGAWQAELLVRRVGQDDARTVLRLVVAGPSGAAAEQRAPTATYPLLPAPMVSVAYGLMAIGAAVMLGALMRRGRAARQARAMLVGAGLLMVASGGYVYAQEQRTGVPLDVANVRNPVPPDERSLADGQAVFAASCAVCHGESGRGDGPGGLRLNPRPADLRVHMAAGHTDGQLFYWVSFGVPGTAMPPWKDALTEEQRWDVINHLRTFAQPAAGGAPPQP